MTVSREKFVTEVPVRGEASPKAAVDIELTEAEASRLVSLLEHSEEHPDELRKFVDHLRRAERRTPRSKV